MKNLTEDSDVAITRLVSQATALEFNDRKIVEANIDPEILQVTSIPDNNGTNLCAFLSLGIVNQLTKNKSCRNNGRLGKINAKKKKKKMHAAFSILAFIYLQYIQIMIRILECLTRTLPQPNLAGMALG